MPRKTWPASGPRKPATGFNEAAARCRGKRRPLRPGARGRGGFNEAAARCRGKRLRRVRLGPDHARASMRPRPDAAENSRLQVRRFLPPRASMRPRPDAAENHRVARIRIRDSGASMRPRPDAAENGERRRVGGLGGGASMRPRPDAAENSVSPLGLMLRPCCFNEAAARCRGKRHHRRARPCGASASMRPRPDAAENARCRGCHCVVESASMRLRPDAAENSVATVAAGADAGLQ